MRFSKSVYSIALLSLLGCPSPKHTSFLSKSFNVSEVITRSREHSIAIRTLRAEGRISIETPNLTQSVAFTLILRKPDSLLIKLEGPFGIRAGWLFATGEDFTFYNALENQLITGQSTSNNFERILHTNLMFSEILEVLCGKGLNTADEREPDEALIENEQPVLVFRDGISTRRYLLDAELHSIAKIQVLDRSGKLTMEQSFASFQEVGTVSVPHSLRILQPRERQFVSIFYSFVRINEEALDFAFHSPTKAQHIRW
jgi:hypothetical protein